MHSSSKTSSSPLSPSRFFGSLFSREEKPVGQKVVRNALFRGLSILIIAPIPFLLIPFIWNKLGANAYGTWAVFLALNSLTSLADIGLLGTLSKHVADYYTHKDFPSLNRLVNTGFVLYLIIAGTVAVLLWLASPLLLSLLFRNTTVTLMILRTVWHYWLVLVAINVMTLLFSSVTVGLQRMDLSSIMVTFAVLSQAVLSVLFLMMGGGVLGLIRGYLIAGLVTLLLYAWIVRKLVPELILNPLRFEWYEMKSLLSFSLQLYLTQVAVAVHYQIDKVYLTWFSGVVPVGWYDIASDPAVKLRAVPSVVLAPILPAASELAARGDRARLAELYFRAHKYLALIGVPLAFFVAALSRQFVGLWLSHRLLIIAVPLSILVLANFINLTTGPGYYILVGQGILKPGAYSAIAGLALNLFLSGVLIYLHGFMGAVIGTSLSLILAAALFFYLFHRETQYSFSRLIRQSYAKPALSALAALAVVLGLHRPPVTTWAGLMLEGLLCGILYSLGLLLTRFFDRFDLVALENLMPSARVLKRIVTDA